MLWERPDEGCLAGGEGSCPPSVEDGRDNDRRERVVAEQPNVGREVHTIRGQKISIWREAR